MNQKHKKKLDKTAIGDNDSIRLKKITNKHQMAYTLVNFLVLAVLFVTSYALLYGVAYTRNYIRMENQLKEMATVLKHYPPLEQHNELLPIDKEIIYYDTEGNLLKNMGNAPALARKLPAVKALDSCYYTTVDNKSIMVYSTKLNSGETMRICDFTDIGDGIFIRLLSGISIIVPIAMVILLLASMLLARTQIKPYQKAVDSSLTFTSNVSHELSTPLSIVKANLENILSLDNEEKYSQQLVASIAEVDRLKRLTSQLLLLSRSDNKRLTYIMQKHNLKKVLDNIIEPYCMLAEEQGKEFYVYFQGQLDDYYMIDKDLYHQVLAGILDNAIKYTEKGENISIYARAQKGKFYCTLTDTGKGVAEEELEKIFLRFYRSEESRTTVGTGLGLPIVHAIVSTLGGKIVATNLSPKGFSISLTIPIELWEEGTATQKKKKVNG